LTGKKQAYGLYAFTLSELNPERVYIYNLKFCSAGGQFYRLFMHAVHPSDVSVATVFYRA
jgi:hypothetical protein